MDKITIETVLNGWKVKVGCQEVVFTEADKLCSELKEYLADPMAVRKRYTEGSVNAKWCHAPQIAEQPMQEAETARVVRNIGSGVTSAASALRPMNG